MSNEDHWRQVHDSKAEDQVSWFQTMPETSLRLIQNTGLSTTARLIDVGGGASRLVDNLLDLGYSQLAVLDITEGGMARAKERLGARADVVHWVVSDVTRYQTNAEWDLWHDRAVFHFLVDADDRKHYRQVLESAVVHGGHVIIGTFGPDGPEKCSGLPVQRYSAEALAAELGSVFAIRESVIEDHRTPSGAKQQFMYARFERSGTGERQPNEDT
jgi:SAM-dependent methyltransferase